MSDLEVQVGHGVVSGMAVKRKSTGELVPISLGVFNASYWTDNNSRTAPTTPAGYSYGPLVRYLLDCPPARAYFDLIRISAVTQKPINRYSSWAGRWRLVLVASGYPEIKGPLIELVTTPPNFTVGSLQGASSFTSVFRVVPNVAYQVYFEIQTASNTGSAETTSVDYIRTFFLPLG